MRGDEIRERLRRQNPWWRAAGDDSDPLAWISDDPTLEARRPFDLGYRSDLLDDVASGPITGKLIVVSGPRQVGKSVLLRDTAAALCARPDLDPRQIVYLATDGLGATDLDKVVMLASDLTRSAGNVQRIWLLDDVAGISGWAEAIERLRHDTQLGVDTVVCSGSSGGKQSRLLHPMSFRHTLVATGSRVPLPRRAPLWGLQTTSTRAVIERLEPFVNDLDLAWRAYLASGGLPRAVAEQHHQGKVGDAFVHDLAAGLRRDVDPGAGEGSVPTLLAELARRCTAPLNRTQLATHLAYPGRTQLDARLARLVDTFAVFRSHQLNQAGKAVARTQSKVYLADPLLAWLDPRLGSGLPDPDLAHVAEAAIGAALARAIDAREPGRWVAGNLVGFVTTGSHNEIDFAPVPVRGPAGQGRGRSVPIEARWMAMDWRTEAKPIEGRFLSGIVATQQITDLAHPTWAVPAPVVALLLG